MNEFSASGRFVDREAQALCLDLRAPESVDGRQKFRHVKLARLDGELPGLQLRQIKDIADDADERSGTLLSRFEVGEAPHAIWFLLDQPQQAIDAIGRSPYLMGDHSHKVRLGNICALGVRTSLNHRRLEGRAFADISNRDDEAPDFAIVDRVCRYLDG